MISLSGIVKFVSYVRKNADSFVIELANRNRRAGSMEKIRRDLETRGVFFTIGRNCLKVLSGVSRPK